MDSTLPTGTVTFLFTDIEGSTRLWEQHPQAMERALSRHDALAGQIITHLGAVDRAEVDRNIAAARTASGSEGFAAAWEAGRALSPEEAVAEALHDG